MFEGYPLRKFTIKEGFSIIITSSLVLQLLVTRFSLGVVHFLPEKLLLLLQIEAQGTVQLVYSAAVLGTVISLPLTLLVIYKNKIPFFNRKHLKKEESFLIRGLTKADWKFLLSYIPLSFLFFNIGYSLIVRFFGEGEALNQLAVESMFNYLPTWQIFLMTVIVAPIVEEVLFRGLILFSGGKQSPSWFRLIISSLLFGLVHSPTNIASLYTYVGMGFLFAYAAKRTNSLEAPIVYHFLNNLLGFIGILFFSR